jgi:ribosomal protein S18 acetylase RimI-like enzyme
MSLEEFSPIFEELTSNGSFQVCQDGNAVIGTCMVQRNRHKRRFSAYVGLLAVSPKYKGKGTALFIMQSVLKQLENEGFKRIELHTAVDNERAIRFFESLGFKTEATLPDFFIRPDSEEFKASVIMSKIF